jgi:hypothetical protein
MKKTLLLITIVTLLSIPAVAQFENDKILLGGSLSSSFSSDRDQFAFSPAVGIVLNESSVTGVRTAFSNSSSEGFQSSNSSSLYFLGGFYRKYWTIKDYLFVFGQADASYIGGTDERNDFTSSNSTTFSRSGFTAGISPGVTVRLSEWLLLDFTMGELRYTTSTLSPDQGNQGDEERTSFGITLNQPNLGFVFSF